MAPYNEVLHLFVVLTEPDPHGECLLVMITSIKQGRTHDASCVLDAGDHEFVKHPSYALYRMADTGFSAHIMKMISKNLYIPRADVSASLLKRITDGLYDSDETRGRVRKFAVQAGI